MSEIHQIQELLHQKTDLQARIRLIPYNGAPEVKTQGDNHYLISQGQGFLVIPEKAVPTFKRLLVTYYENDDLSQISEFMKQECWQNFE